jgi:2-isopropylmalate synthase
MKTTVYIYDTTLRDGAQAEDVNFSVEDKVRSPEAGPVRRPLYRGRLAGLEPRDIEFFREMRRVRLGRRSLRLSGPPGGRKSRSPTT